jgi:hypothetical protein
MVKEGRTNAQQGQPDLVDHAIDHHGRDDELDNPKNLPILPDSESEIAAQKRTELWSVMKARWDRLKAPTADAQALRSAVSILADADSFSVPGAVSAAPPSRSRLLPAVRPVRSSVVGYRTGAVAAKSVGNLVSGDSDEQNSCPASNLHYNCASNLNACVRNALGVYLAARLGLADIAYARTQAGASVRQESFSRIIRWFDSYRVQNRLGSSPQTLTFSGLLPAKEYASRSTAMMKKLSDNFRAVSKQYLLLSII